MRPEREKSTALIYAPPNVSRRGALLVAAVLACKAVVASAFGAPADQRSSPRLQLAASELEHGVNLDKRALLRHKRGRQRRPCRRKHRLNLGPQMTPRVVGGVRKEGVLEELQV